MIGNSRESGRDMGMSNAPPDAETRQAIHLPGVLRAPAARAREILAHEEGRHDALRSEGRAGSERQCVSTRPAQRIRKKLGMIVTSSGTISAVTRKSAIRAAPAKAHARQGIARERRDEQRQGRHGDGDVERVEVLPREGLMVEDLDEVPPLPLARNDAGRPKISAALLKPDETIQRNGKTKGMAATQSASRPADLTDECATGAA